MLNLIPQATSPDLDAPRRKPGRPKKVRFAEPPADYDDDGRPIIKIVEGNLPEMTDRACDILADPTLLIFRRGSDLYRPVSVGRRPQTLSLRSSERISRAEGAIVLAQVDDAALVDVLTRSATFMRYDLRHEEWVRRDCPSKVAVTILARRGQGWRMPPLKAVVRTPILRADGSIQTELGYDPQSQIYFASDREWRDLPAEITKAEAKSSLDVLASSISTLPFASDVDRAAAVGLLLTALVRPILPTAPLFAVSAPSAGTGKSMLIDIAGIVATGSTVPSISGVSDDEELQKHIGSCLLAGDQLVCLDNLTGVLKADFLCTVLTQENTTVRILGQSKVVQLPNSTLICATGNGLSVGGDMTRRTVLIKLDAKHENPETRTFPTDIKQVALQRRQDFVMAGLSALRAYIASNERVDLPEALGGFEAWSELVRGCLLWCGWPDPIGNKTVLKEEDPQKERLSGVVQALSGMGTFTAKIIAREVRLNSQLAEDLSEFFDRKKEFSAQNFGSFLRRNQDRPLNGLKIKKMKVVKDIAHWAVEKSED